MWRLLKLWRYITMSDKRYAVMRTDKTFFSTYEEAEKEAKKLASKPSISYNPYSPYYYCTSPTVEKASDYYIMESVALAKEPTPDVEVVKIV